MSPLQQLLDRRQALEAQQLDLTRQIDAAHDAQRDEVIQGIKALMDNHGLTIADVLGRAGSTERSVNKVAPKYRDPDTGSTWTGRGLQPRWMRAAIARGKQPQDFLI
jgi:DNA-binding protein H-NS